MDADPLNVETAQRLLRIRALRWDYFRGDLFDEYAWNILLVLYIAGASDRATSDATVGEEASVPPSVNLRWIAHLEQSGLIEREPDSGMLRLSDRSRADMSEYLHEVGTMLYSTP